MNRLLRRLRRPLLEFLAVPVLIVAAFVVLAEVVDWADNRAVPRHGWGEVRTWLSQYAGDTQSAIGVLSAIAGSLFTVTSITFSILLLAVQQGATVLNSQIVDHYLRRFSNRAWFGFFVGVALFVLITLVQTTHTSSPVFGVTISTLLGAVSLIALVVLIYSTIDQTRPSTVLAIIGDAALAARARQRELLEATAAPVAGMAPGHPILAGPGGYLLRIEVAALRRAMAAAPGARLLILRAIGDYVPTGTAIATISGAAAPERVAQAVLAALPLADQRDVTHDAALGLHHLATIGWTAISTARSDPAVGGIVVHTLQRLLHAWSAAPRRAGDEALIHYADELPDHLLDALESLVVAASESRQHHSLALILSVLAIALPVLPPARRRAAAPLVATAIRTLPDHQPTRILVEAVGRLSAGFRAVGDPATADRLDAALAPPA